MTIKLNDAAPTEGEITAVEIRTDDLPKKQSIDIIQYNAWSLEARELADLIVIEDDATESQASEAMLRIQKFHKDADADRAEKKAPFFAMGNRIDDVYRPFLSSFMGAIDIIKDKIKNWRIKKEEIRKRLEAEEQERYRREIVEASEHPLSGPAVVQPAPAILPAQKATRSEAGTVSERKFWTFEIVDPMQIPRAYLMIDEKAIRAAVKAGVRDIPGVRIFEDIQISGRTK